LLEEEWCRVEPGENGKSPEKLVIPDSGLRGGMLKGIFGVSKVSKEVKEMYQSYLDANYGILDRYTLRERIDSYLIQGYRQGWGEGKYKLLNDFVEYSLDKLVQKIGINNSDTKYLITDVIWAYSSPYSDYRELNDIHRDNDVTELIVKFCERYQKKHPAEIRDILDHLINYRASYGRCLIPICERLFGPNGSKTLDAMGNVVMAYMEHGDYDRGTKVYEDLVARAGRDHPKIAQVLDRMLDKAKYS
jgi:hypothetical protein